jgi:regulator of replication initiation timing
MRFLKFFLLTSLIISCASKKQSEPVNQRIENVQPKTHSEMQEFAVEMIDSHQELTPEQRVSIKELLTKSIEKNAELKKEESKLVQIYLEDVIVKKVPKSELYSIQKKMKKVYKDKYDNFIRVFQELNRILGVSEKNNEVSKDLIRAFRDLR